MSMLDKVDGRYFSDEDVEKTFGVSHSKLRTAQRFGLVESAMALSSGRYIRMWSEDDVYRVTTASLMSQYVGVPFQACCCILLNFYEVHPEAEDFREFAKLNTPADPDRLHEEWSRNPVVALANKETVYVVSNGARSVIGRLTQDAHGRAAFELDPDATMPTLPETLSWSIFNPVAAISKILQMPD